MQDVCIPLARPILTEPAAAERFGAKARTGYRERVKSDLSDSRACRAEVATGEAVSSLLRSLEF